MIYLLLKSLHIMAVIAWMAGLFYLPRLFVYHADAPVGSPQSELFKIMERRLYRAIMNPAMMVSWAVGLWLVYDANFWLDGWFHAKFALVCVMTFMHLWYGRLRGQFARDENRHSHKFYRVINEVPTLLMVGIVILVILKPF